jgi:virulence-associated protein VagC
VEKGKVFELLGMQVIVIPKSLQFDAEVVYLLREGITVRVIPATEEGDKVVEQARHKFFTDPERAARRKVAKQPHATKSVGRKKKPNDPSQR